MENIKIKLLNINKNNKSISIIIKQHWPFWVIYLSQILAYCIKLCHITEHKTRINRSPSDFTGKLHPKTKYHQLLTLKLFQNNNTLFLLWITKEMFGEILGFSVKEKVKGDQGSFIFACTVPLRVWTNELYVIRGLSGSNLQFLLKYWFRWFSLECYAGCNMWNMMKCDTECPLAFLQVLFQSSRRLFYDSFSIPDSNSISSLFLWYSVIGKEDDIRWKKRYKKDSKDAVWPEGRT